MTPAESAALIGATFAALADRRAVGDQAICDWLDLLRITADRSPRQVVTAELVTIWGCSQPMVSRRLARINRAPGGANLGRVARVRGTRQWQVAPLAAAEAP